METHNANTFGMARKPLSSLDAPISPPRVKYRKRSSAQTENPIARYHGVANQDERNVAPRLASIEAGEVVIKDHLTTFSEQLKRVKKTLPGKFLSMEGFVDLYKRNLHKQGHHFVIHQHDHPIAGVHYDLRLQISETSSISFAIMYGLPGNPNSKRLNRNATETRVHNLWNHLIETASHSTGSLLIWDIGEYSVLPYRRPEKETDDELSSDSSNTSSALSESEKLHLAFHDRKIRLRLHGTRLPANYTISIRLPSSNNRTAQPKKPTRKRRRVATGRSAAAARTINSSASSEGESEKVPNASVELDAHTSAIEQELAEQEDEQIRLTNAYPGATNSIHSIHQRTWYLSLDRLSSGFALRKHADGTRAWVRAQDGEGFEPFFVKGTDTERSVVTGRLSHELMANEGVVGYVGRKGWRPILE
ncbi:hypothetical protein MMC07_005793 [Pseudocyphellaria aurata]|nr:hypothetical protein [Pseudocyphellaria aurata]